MDIPSKKEGKNIQTKLRLNKIKSSDLGNSSSKFQNKRQKNRVAITINKRMKQSEKDTQKNIEEKLKELDDPENEEEMKVIYEKYKSKKEEVRVPYDHEFLNFRRDNSLERDRLIKERMQLRRKKNKNMMNIAIQNQKILDFKFNKIELL